MILTSFIIFAGSVYANYDVASWEEDCSTNEIRSTADVPEWIDNATCDYTYTRD